MISLELLLPLFLWLVVVDNQSLTIDGETVPVLSVLLNNLGSTVLVLEAHKSRAL